jgi:feruloyl-CoA synthase
VWVSVGTLRMRALSVLAPLAQDIVIAGHDRDEITFLIFPNMAACRAFVVDLPPQAPNPAVLAHPRIVDHIAAGLSQLRKESPASSTHAARAILLEQPPLIDVGEITDKGYINQRAVLARRPSLVQALYSPDHPAVISARQP